jgi:hypothetical protein
MRARDHESAGRSASGTIRARHEYVTAYGYFRAIPNLQEVNSASAAPQRDSHNAVRQTANMEARGASMFRQFLVVTATR